MSTQTMEERQGTSVKYWIVFGVLAIFTALEVVVGYMTTLPQGIKAAVLIFLAIVKVALVLLYFMHLKFDSRLFALPFALGIVLAIPITLIIGLTMQAPISTEFKEAQAVNTTGQVIDVKEVSFQIQFSQYSAQAGPVTFHIVNGADDMLHEFIIIQTDVLASDLPTDDSGRVQEDAVTIITAAEDIPPSNSRNVTVNLGAGHYVIVCNLPGHYQQGMRVDFNVTGTSNQPPSTPKSPAQATEPPTQPPAATPGS